jgi:hypothetical protein
MGGRDDQPYAEDRRYSSIRIDGDGYVYTFAGTPKLHLDAATNTFFVSMRDAADPSRRRVVWRQRTDGVRAEVVTIIAGHPFG